MSLVTWAYFLFSLKGRVPRRDYWLRFLLPLFIIPIVMVIIMPSDASWLIDSRQSEGDLSSVSVTPVAYLLAIALTWIQIAAGIKRYHDLGRSGWWLLIYLLPFIGPLLVFGELGLREGTPGPNRFGERPH